MGIIIITLGENLMHIGDICNSMKINEIYKFYIIFLQNKIQNQYNSIKNKWTLQLLHILKK